MTSLPEIDQAAGIGQAGLDVLAYGRLTDPTDRAYMRAVADRVNHINIRNAERLHGRKA